jgi:DNA-binding response OmpR family regulator
VNPEIWSRSLDTHVSNLRNKLALRPASGFRLTAVYGVGYRLESLDESGATAASPEAAPSE